MKLMINTPIPHLDLVSHLDQHLVLAHLLENKEYLDFYKKQRERGAYLVLDNGVIETGTPQIDESKVKALHPREVVAPDYLYDAERTCFESAKFAGLIKSEFPSMKVMCVPQGDSPKEYLICLKTFANAPWCDVIGIGKAASLALTPKVARPTQPIPSFVVAGRHRALTYLLELRVKKPVHILGLSHPNELRVYSAFPNVRSVDTSWCFRIVQDRAETDFHSRLNPDQLARVKGLMSFLESLCK